MIAGYATDAVHELLRGLAQAQEKLLRAVTRVKISNKPGGMSTSLTSRSPRQVKLFWRKINEIFKKCLPPLIVMKTIYKDE